MLLLNFYYLRINKERKIFLSIQVDSVSWFRQSEVTFNILYWKSLLCDLFMGSEYFTITASFK